MGTELHFIVVGDINSDWLRAGRSGDKIPVGARFFAHVQTGPGAHPASCKMGTRSFPGVKRPGRGADHPPLSEPLPPLWAFGSVTGYLYFYGDINSP
jgi:hypothetical protein